MLRPVTRVPNRAYDESQAMNLGVSVAGYKEPLIFNKWFKEQVHIFIHHIFHLKW